MNGVFILKSLYGAFEEWGLYSYLGELKFFLNGVQRAWVSPSGDWNILSDQNLKTGIVPFKSVLEGIKKLKICSYSYKNDVYGARSFGLIAQEAAQYFPEIVSESADKDGKKLLGIAYNKTGLLALKAVQEQQQMIESMQQEIAQLKKLVSESINNK